MSCGCLSITHSTNGIVYNTAFEAVLRRNSLLDFNSVVNIGEGETIKQAVPQRSTVRFFLQNRDASFAVYLKRHYPLSAAGFFSAVLRRCLPKTAVDEFMNIVAFHEAGIPTLTPLAAGMQKSGFFQTTSFLLTRALEGCARLDHVFTEHVPSVERKRAIIVEVARLIKRMHSCGFNHRDLYLCHILCDTRGGLFIVDLHRVDRRRRVPGRWKVKDIAALNYSAPAATITRTDRLRFLKCYLGFERLSGKQKVFARKVLKKTEKMIQHNRTCNR